MGEEEAEEHRLQRDQSGIHRVLECASCSYSLGNIQTNKLPFQYVFVDINYLGVGGIDAGSGGGSVGGHELRRVSEEGRRRHVSDEG